MEKNFFGLPSSDVSTIESSDDDETLALEEGSDVKAESLKYSPLVAFVQERFDRSKTRRKTDETRWLSSYRNFRGLYGPEVRFTDTEKSQAFAKITKTKVFAAYAQVVDVLFSGGKFPVGVENSPVPEGIAESVHVDPKEPEGIQSTIVRPDLKALLGGYQKKLEPIADKLKEGPGTTPTSLTWEPAKDAAKKMDKQIQDQLLEANAETELHGTLFEMCLFGHGILKGPMALDKEYPKWSAEGEYLPVIKTIPDIQHVSIWDAYPDPDAINMKDAECFVQRHRMSKTQLRQLKKRPYFREDSIELAIEGGFNYMPEYWENELKDYRIQSGIERFEVLEYWGSVDKEFEEITELDIPKQYKDKDQVQVNIWVCNGIPIRVVFNPFTPARIPFYTCPYELNPYSFFGIGVAENMEDMQLAMNGFWRLAIDNAILSGNVILEINENNLVPGQDMKFEPGKVFRTNGAQGQSIWSTKIDNHIQENLAIFDKARQLADEATGIPSYSHGQGGIQGIGRTAAGMSMLMGAAAQNIKSVVRNIDLFILGPLGKALFAFNMQFNFDEEFVGDLEVVARGTQSLMRNEIRSQKLLQFLQLTNNPVDGPWAKRDYLLRELAECLDLESDKAVNDPREAGIQAMLMKDLMLAQGIDPNQQKAQGGASVPGTGVDDPTGGSSSVSQPGASPEPGAQGFSGGGGGSANAAAVNSQKAQ